ncbi:Pecanex-like protein 1 [Actinomycetes bacterium KLBMP 9759]
MRRRTVMERLGAEQRQRSSRRQLTIVAVVLLALAVPAAYAYGSTDAPQDNSGLVASLAGHSSHNAAPQPDNGADTEAPPNENPGAENPGAENPGAENPGAENPGAENPEAENPGAENPGAENPGAENPGNEDAGNGDAGQQNDADRRGRGNNGNGNGNGNGNNGGGQQNNGLDVLGRDCRNSDLDRHTGFQVAPACVDTAFGEVADEDKSPSLLITESPDRVGVGESFTLRVSTRNLVRDRFLGAAAGGYYLESSFLNDQGLQRGHFHTACRMLPNGNEAPDSAPAPEFFLATQDNRGGAEPDTVTIEVTGMPTAGQAQCTVWAGDGSHRLPMMQRANQTPAVDSVRIDVG